MDAKSMNIILSDELIRSGFESTYNSLITSDKFDDNILTIYFALTHVFDIHPSEALSIVYSDRLYGSLLCYEYREYLSDIDLSEYDDSFLLNFLRSFILSNNVDCKSIEDYISKQLELLTLVGVPSPRSKYFKSSLLLKLSLLRMDDFEDTLIYLLNESIDDSCVSIMRYAKDGELSKQSALEELAN